MAGDITLTGWEDNGAEAGHGEGQVAILAE
jgi:hypothetical protein